MKILYVIHRFLPCDLTGSEIVFATLSSDIAARPGYEVLVATGNIDSWRDFYLPSAKKYSRSEVYDKLRVERLRVNWFSGAVCHILHRLFPRSNRWMKGRLGVRAFGPHLIGLEKLIRVERPDLIHAGPLPLYHVHATWRIAHKLRIPFVVTPMMHFELPMFQNPLFYPLFKGASGVVSFTNYERDRLVENGVDRAKIEVIPAFHLSARDFEPADGSAFRKENSLTDEPLILFLGSKDYDKGALFLLEAWPGILEKIPRARLVFAGFSTRRWEQSLMKKPLRGIIDLGYVRGEEKRSLLAACTLLCAPSRAESFGIVILEAWAQAKPVIGGSAGATREIITEGEDGVTVDFGDVDTLSKQVIELLSDPLKQARFGRNGRKKAELFTEESVVGKTLALYEKVAR